MSANILLTAFAARIALPYLLNIYNIISIIYDMTKSEDVIFDRIIAY